MAKLVTRQTLPWWIAAILAIALVVTHLPHGSGTDNTVDGVVQDGSGKRVLYWADPMYALGPPHVTIAKAPGIAADCHMKLVPIYAEMTPPSTSTTPAPAGYGSVAMTPGRQQLIGVKLGKAEVRDLSRTVRTTGVVAADERRMARIQTKFEGFVDTLSVNFTGETVHRGQPLLSIYSPDLLATQNELLLAAKNRSQFGGTLVEAAKRRLMLWDMAPADIDEVVRSGRPQRDVILRSPVDGVVVTKNVVAGARVMPGDTLYELADLRAVWVLADVYESELPFIRIGTVAQVSAGGNIVNGRVAFVAPSIDPRTRTAKVRIELANAGGTLKPDMYATVTLQVGSGSGVTVPESAVLQTGTRSIVFVASGNGRFDPREVMTGTHGDGFYEIRGGVAAGESVVIDANFLVDSESRLKSALGQLGGSAQKAVTP